MCINIRDERANLICLCRSAPLAIGCSETIGLFAGLQQDLIDLSLLVSERLSKKLLSWVRLPKGLAHTHGSWHSVMRSCIPVDSIDQKVSIF